ncbi:hypothetical protein HPB49_022237 [Dermacentor silvarum]|uniref:Uncharacterized protein n=1 Tax=Dermacentor silvarum TaxID=543639 RepID=A0ACB8DFL7_DERSI|nr:hypothetical protein HPB49_022237 [Dermacentor silvarum]
MAPPELGNEAPRKPNNTDAAQSSGGLAEVNVARSPYMGNVVDFNISCTATGNQTCQLVKRLSTYNEFLCQVGLELRYSPDSPCATGHLRLYTFPGPFPALGDKTNGKAKQAVSLMYSLLRTHQCISAVHVRLGLWDTYRATLCDALRDNESVRQLNVESELLTREVSAVIPTLRNLEETVYTVKRVTSKAVLMLSLILSSTSLTTLRIHEGIKWLLSQSCFTALKASSTLKELSLGSSLSEAFPHVALVDDPGQEAFEDYLRSTRTLTTLTFTANRAEGQNYLNFLLRGLLENETLTKVTLGCFRFCQESVLLASKVISENRVLRIFRIAGNSVFPPDIPSDIHDYWREAMRKNETLEELTLPLFAWSPVIWEGLFDILVTKERMKTLTIEDVELSELSALESICGAVRQIGVEQKVTIRQASEINSLVDFTASTFVAFPIYILFNVAVFVDLPSVDFVATLSVLIVNRDPEIASALANYIESASLLSSLRLHVAYNGNLESNDENSSWWSVVLHSLSRNSSIKEVSINCGENMDDQYLEDLADTVVSSGHITRVIIWSHSTAFTRRLSVYAKGNYTLLSVILCDRSCSHAEHCWFTVRDAARRNCDLVTRAALFAKGFRFDRFHAAGLEQACAYPMLREELTQLLSVGEIDGVSMIRKRLRSIQGVHDFMRVAGVVKERVVCYPREDGYPQLDVLPELCWRHIRGYLSLDDICDSQPSTENYP